jgi:hypothetical protein
MRALARKFLGAFAVLAVVVAALAALAVPTTAEQAGDVAPQASGIDDSVPPPPGAGKVLILDTSVNDGINSTESQAAQALGLGVDVVTPATWAALSTAQFGAYQAIIVGDPSCGGDSDWAAASANTGTWAPAVDGNVITNGTDPVFHESSEPGALELTQRSVAFAAADASKTGFYASLSCWEPASGTPVDILNAISPGWTAGPAGCGDAISVVATNPILAGLTNEELEGWSCSVHEFFETWPSDFVVIAIDTDAAPVYTAPDGSQGSPYILGRGGGLVAGNISLTPESGTSDVNSAYEMTAFVQWQGTVQVGTTVTLTCEGGPNAGLSTSAVTNDVGNAVFTLTAATNGTDTCHASFVNPNSASESSNAATVEWTGAVLQPLVIQPRFTG